MLQNNLVLLKNHEFENHEFKNFEAFLRDFLHNFGQLRQRREKTNRFFQKVRFKKDLFEKIELRNLEE